MNREDRERYAKDRSTQKSRGSDAKDKLSGNPEIVEYIESLEERIENLEEIHNLDIEV